MSELVRDAWRGFIRHPYTWLVGIPLLLFGAVSLYVRLTVSDEERATRARAYLSSATTAACWSIRHDLDLDLNPKVVGADYLKRGTAIEAEQRSLLGALDDGPATPDHLKIREYLRDKTKYRSTEELEVLIEQAEDAGHAVGPDRLRTAAEACDRLVPAAGVGSAVNSLRR